MTRYLDPRHRAMLAEMHVQVWSPMAETAQTPSQTPAMPEASQTPADTTSAPRLAVPVAARAVSSMPAPPAAQTAAAVARLPRPEGVDQMAWPALQQTVSQCRACGLCDTRHHTVFGVGAPAVSADASSADTAPQVEWLIVGEAPGENEDLQGEPFVGQAGKLLDNILTAMGLARRARTSAGGVYISNVLKCRPPGNRNPRPEEVAQCLPYLERQVALLQPQIILAMGRFAVQALLRDSVPAVETIPLGKLRGQVHSYQGVPVVVTYHPAYLLRNLPEKAKLWADVCLAMATLQQTPTRD